MLNQEDNKIVDHLPKTLLSGIIVGFSSRGLSIGYLLTHMLVFSIGALVGWIFHN